jgi:hypothetical protein
VSLIVAGVVSGSSAGSADAGRLRARQPVVAKAELAQHALAVLAAARRRAHEAARRALEPRVADPGHLHLDDVGAPVGQPPAAGGTRAHLRQVDDADAPAGRRRRGGGARPGLSSVKAGLSTLRP